MSLRLDAPCLSANVSQYRRVSPPKGMGGDDELDHGRSNHGESGQCERKKVQKGPTQRPQQLRATVAGHLERVRNHRSLVMSAFHPSQTRA